MQHLKRCKHTFFLKKREHYPVPCTCYVILISEELTCNKKNDELQVPCTGNTKVSFMCVYNTKKRIANLRA